MTSDQKKGERRGWSIVVVAALVIGFLAVSLIATLATNAKANRNAAGLARAQAAQAAQVEANKLQVACQSRFNFITSQRTKIVSRYSGQKEVALLAVLDAQPGTPTYAAARKAYRETQSALVAARAKYPPPTYTCALPRGPTPSLTPSPLPPTPSTVTKSATATATATKTATVPVPGPTATTTKHVRMPGPTVTKTVTRTVSPPSCLTHPIPPCVLTVN